MPLQASLSRRVTNLEQRSGPPRVFDERGRKAVKLLMQYPAVYSMALRLRDRLAANDPEAIREWREAGLPFDSRVTEAARLVFQRECSAVQLCSRG